MRFLSSFIASLLLTSLCCWEFYINLAKKLASGAGGIFFAGGAGGGAVGTAVFPAYEADGVNFFSEGSVFKFPAESEPLSDSLLLFVAAFIA